MTHPTLRAAEVLSEKLVEAAIAHITQRLTDRAWLATHRKVSAQLDYASWAVPGCNHLIQPEMEKVRDALRAQGWRTAVMTPQFHDASSNWEARVSFRAS